MTGRLYVVGVGPGDPELLTLKGARILREVGCICVPKGKEEGGSLALSIVKKAVSLEGSQIVETYFPMKRPDHASHRDELDSQWREAASVIVDRLKKGIDTAFVTIGDPGIYSTFFYLYDRLMEALPRLRIEIVPGVSSINASAARAGMCLALGDDRVAILPASRALDLKKLLKSFETVVLLKVYRVFGEVHRTLADLGLLERATLVCRAGMEDERVYSDLSSLEAKGLDYFSLIIVRR